MKATGLGERLADALRSCRSRSSTFNTLEGDKRRLEMDATAIGKEARTSAAQIGKLEWSVGRPAAAIDRLAASRQCAIHKSRG